MFQLNRPLLRNHCLECLYMNETTLIVIILSQTIASIRHALINHIDFIIWFQFILLTHIIIIGSFSLKRVLSNDTELMEKVTLNRFRFLGDKESHFIK